MIAAHRPEEGGDGVPARDRRYRREGAQRGEQKLKLEQLVVSKGKFKDIGAAIDRDDKLKKDELEDLLAFDPSKTALGHRLGAPRTR